MKLASIAEQFAFASVQENESDRGWPPGERGIDFTVGHRGGDTGREEERKREREMRRTSDGPTV
jgi:hypothetical protein